MPENAIYYQAAYAALIVMFVGYALSIAWRRRAVARKHRAVDGAP